VTERQFVTYLNIVRWVRLTVLEFVDGKALRRSWRAAIRLLESREISPEVRYQGLQVDREVRRDLERWTRREL